MAHSLGRVSNIFQKILIKKEQQALTKNLILNPLPLFFTLIFQKILIKKEQQGYSTFQEIFDHFLLFQKILIKKEQQVFTHHISS